MDAEPRGPTIETLLAHADWVRSLAGRLVADPSRADDVAQDAWVAAIESPPRDARNVKGWLSAIVRNTAREFGRSERRRATREHRASKPEASEPSSSDLVQRANLQTELARHVLALDEPYRTVVLLRWFEGLTPRAIAKRLDRPIETVTTQLARAHEKLRSRLDREYGERSSWCALLSALAHPQHAVTTSIVGSSIGGAIVIAGWKIAVSTGALIVLGFFAWLRFAHVAGDGPSELVAEQPTIQQAELIATPTAPPADDVATRTPVIDGAPITVPAMPTRALPSRALSVATVKSGRVVDQRGQAIARLPLIAHDPSAPYRAGNVILMHDQTVVSGAGEIERLRSHPDEVEALIKLKGLRGLGDVILGTDIVQSMVTDIDGRFVVDPSGERGNLTALDSADDRWRIFTSGFDPTSGEHVYFAAHPITVAGDVLDPNGAPVSSAQVGFALGYEWLRELPFALEGGTAGTSSRGVSSNGHFRLPWLPQVDCLMLDVRARGWETAHVLLPRNSNENMRIVLQPSASKPARKLSGVVLDAKGTPVPQASVAFGQEDTKTDANGKFVLATQDYGDTTDLVAAEAGARAAVIAAFGRDVAQSRGDFQALVLQLGDAPLAIIGRLLDAAGAPCVGWEVDLYDGTPCGHSVDSAEGVAAGRNYHGNAPITDVEGRFRIEGLLSRAYQVRAMNADHRLLLVSEPFLPGSGELTLRLPADALRARVSGRVVTKSGAPVAGISITVDARTAENKEGSTHGFRPNSTKTDELGRFELKDVIRYHAEISVWGDGVDRKRITLDPNAPGENLEIVVGRRARFNVVPAVREEADGFELVDAQGARLTTRVHYSWDYVDSTRVARDEAGFPVCEASDEAVALVLLRGENELRRVPIALRPGETNVIRP